MRNYLNLAIKTSVSRDLKIKTIIHLLSLENHPQTVKVVASKQLRLTAVLRLILRKDFALQTPKALLVLSMNFLLRTKDHPQINRIINQHPSYLISQDTIVQITPLTVPFQISLSPCLNLVVTFNRSIWKDPTKYLRFIKIPLVIVILIWMDNRLIRCIQIQATSKESMKFMTLIIFLVRSKALSQTLIQTV